MWTRFRKILPLTKDTYHRMIEKWVRKHFIVSYERHVCTYTLWRTHHVLYKWIYVYVRAKNFKKYENVTSLKEMRCANEGGNLIYVAVKLKSPLGMHPATCIWTRLHISFICLRLYMDSFIHCEIYEAKSSTMQSQCRHYANEGSPKGINTNKEKENCIMALVLKPKTKGELFRHRIWHISCGVLQRFFKP